MKPTIPEVLPLVKEWKANPENPAIFHLIFDDCNYEQKWADLALKEAIELKNQQAINLALKLQSMSCTQRKKLSTIDSL